MRTRTYEAFAVALMITAIALTGCETGETGAFAPPGGGSDGGVDDKGDCRGGSRRCCRGGARRCSDAEDQCPNDSKKIRPGICGCGVPDRDSDRDGTWDCLESCPDDPSKTEPGMCGCGQPEGSCDGTAEARLPIEVLGPSGTSKTVRVELNGSVNDITHLLVTCHACGYNDHALDSDPSRVKAAVQVNGGPPISLKHYTLADDERVVGNRDIRLLHADDAGYGGIGGGFRTNSMVLPIHGLRRGANELTFTHVDADNVSIGFRILHFNLLRGDSPSATVFRDGAFVEDDPRGWSVADAVGSNSAAAQQAAIERGKRLWYQRDHLYDPMLDALDGRSGGPRPLDGQIRASCSDCHAQDGRDLAYFNFSDESIVERAYFHGVPRERGRDIAAYIRSLDVPYAENARPWNPPYQPGAGLDSRPAHEWAAGAGIDAVLASDADMEPYLFPRGTSAQDVRDVVDRFGTLNMRELPVAVQMPDWNQWLPVVHPSDAFDTSSRVITSDEDGDNVGQPFYEYLYERLLSNPTPRRLGDLTKDIEKWIDRGGTCHTQNKNPRKGRGWRTANSLVAQAVQLGDVIPLDASDSQCLRIRHDPALNRPLELAKRGLQGWLTVKQWEVLHTNALETRSARLTEPVCIGRTCVDASEPRGWVTEDRTDKGENVFNRAPHYIAYNADNFLHQVRTTGEYETSVWYHLQMVLNSGFRRTGPNHYIYTIDHLEYMQRYSGVSQSFRFWAGMIKMRQSQTSGFYGVEKGLEPHSAQPYRMYSDSRGNTDLRDGVGRQLWVRIADAMLLDFVGAARLADWENGPDWDSESQATDSTDFDLCAFCSRPFSDRDLVGRNTARLIPMLRTIGVSDSVIDELIDWGADTWPRGPWNRLR